MSRSQNQLQQHYMDCLAERREMRNWIRHAQKLTHVHVTERDWLLWGHLRPEEWLHEAIYPALMEARHEWDVMHEDCWGVYREEDDDDWRPDTAELTEEYEFSLTPTHEQFGGRLYPREHVEDARRRTSATARQTGG